MSELQSAIVSSKSNANNSRPFEWTLPWAGDISNDALIGVSIPEDVEAGDGGADDVTEAEDEVLEPEEKPLVLVREDDDAGESSGEARTIVIFGIFELQI